MARIDQVLDLLRRSDQSFLSTQRREKQVLFALALLAGPFYLGLVALVVFALIHAWQGGDWFTGFWMPLVSAAPLGTGIAKVAIYNDDRRPYFQPVDELRDALRRGDDVLAPKSLPASHAGTTIASSSNSARIGPVRRAASTAGAYSIGFGCVALILLVIGILAFRSDGGTSYGDGTTYDTLAAFIFTAIFLPLSCLLLLYGVRACGRFIIAVDGSGLRWRTPIGRRARLKWADAYALFEVHRSAGIFKNPETQYAVVGMHSALAWRLPSAHATSAASEASDALHRAISEHSGLPLRNLTTVVMRIAGPEEPTSYATRSQGSTVSKAELRRCFKILGFILSPILAIVLVGGCLELYQPTYYEHLYAQAHSHSPILTNPMTSDTGYWPVGNPSPYRDGAYWLTAGDQFLGDYVLAPQTYDNVLIDIDLRLYDEDLANAGLFVLDSEDADSSKAFTVSPDGSFEIGSVFDRYNYNTDDPAIYGSSAEIAQGVGVTNHLSLLIQGSRYTFFVNGHYMGSFDKGVFAGAQFGLYANYTDAAFTNFAVYPLD